MEQKTKRVQRRIGVERLANRFEQIKPNESFELWAQYILDREIRKFEKEASQDA